MNGTIGAARKVFAEAAAPGQKRGGQVPVLAAGAIVAAVALAVFANPGGSVSIALAGAVGLVCVVAAFVYTTRHRDAVIIAVLLSEMLSANVFMPVGFNTATHYVLNFIFCAPLVPILWRSGLIWQGSFRLLLLYFVWCAITVAYSLVPVYSLGRLISSLLLVSALTVLALEVSDKRDVRRLLRNFLLGCGILVALLAASYFLLPHDITFASPDVLDVNGNPIPGAISESSGGIARFVGIFTQPNEVGSLVLVTVGVAVVYWMSASKRTKFLLAALMTAAIVLGILSDSRSSMGALVTGLIVFFLWRYRWRGILVVALAVAAGGLVMILMLSNARTYVDRGDVSTLTGRTEVWDYAVDQIKEAPLLGYGYEVEGEIYELRHFPIWYGPWDEGPRSSIHENYLGHMVGVGIPATLLWLFVMLRPWVALFKRDEDPWGLKPLALMVALPYFIVNFAESSAGDCAYCDGLIFMLCWAIAERARMRAIETAKRDQEIALTQMSPAAAAIASAALTT
jgi:O-antigen ligase